jgi:hypothetical protein
MQIGKLSWVLTALLATTSIAASRDAHAMTPCASFTTQATATRHDGNGNGFYVSPWFTTGTCARIAGMHLVAVDALDDALFPRGVIGIQYTSSGDTDDFNIVPMDAAGWTIIDENAVPPGVNVRLISETKITSIVVEN